MEVEVNGPSSLWLAPHLIFWSPIYSFTLCSLPEMKADQPCADYNL